MAAREADNADAVAELHAAVEARLQGMSAALEEALAAHAQRYASLGSGLSSLAARHGENQQQLEARFYTQA